MGQKYIIMCRSLTYAQRASKLLERAGISSAITKAPQGATVSGCSYGVRLQSRYASNALSIMRSNGISPGKVFSICPDGSVSEVML